MPLRGRLGHKRRFISWGFREPRFRPRCPGLQPLRRRRKVNTGHTAFGFWVPSSLFSSLCLSVSLSIIVYLCVYVTLDSVCQSVCFADCLSLAVTLSISLSLTLLYFLFLVEGFYKGWFRQISSGFAVVHFYDTYLAERSKNQATLPGSYFHM